MLDLRQRTSIYCAQEDDDDLDLFGELTEEEKAAKARFFASHWRPAQHPASGGGARCLGARLRTSAAFAHRLQCRLQAEKDRIIAEAKARGAEKAARARPHPRPPPPVAALRRSRPPSPPLPRSRPRRLAFPSL